MLQLDARPCRLDVGAHHLVDRQIAGMVLVPEIYANPTDAQDEGKALADFVHYSNDFLQTQMNARQ
ncbi:hypothetical protein ACC754_45290, partial [Rhizobium johnstonii]